MENKEKQLSPCIISWAKYALEFKGKEKPKNIKTCSEKYWEKVIFTILKDKKYETVLKNKNIAIAKFNDCVSSKKKKGFL